VNAPRRFWLITFAAGLAVALTIGLGKWQLSRAADKVALAAAIANQATQPALSGLELVARANGAGVMHRPVVLHGRWLPEHTVFLDNRQMNAKPGLFVVTPLALADSPAVVLVQRGWVQRNFLDRSSLPVIDTPSGTVTIKGRIAPPPSKLYELGDPQLGRIRQNLDMAAFARESGLSLLPVSVQQVGAPADGLQRDWSQPATGVDKHYGYAAQWFGLSGLFAILYVWFQIVKKFKPRR
jgi:surfeit locus 1 family protein